MTTDEIALQFFESLYADLIALQTGAAALALYRDVEKGDDMATVMSHVHMLIRQAKLPPPERVRSIIRSSWELVSERGRNLGIFQRANGNQELRAAILAFVNG